MGFEWLYCCVPVTGLLSLLSSRLSSRLPCYSCAIRALARSRPISRLMERASRKDTWKTKLVGAEITSQFQVHEGMDGFEVTPPNVVAKRVILYFHGGAFFTGSIWSHANLIGRLAVASQAVVIAVNYRLGPSHPFPVALHDAVAAWEWVMHRFPDSAVALAGDSAGGNLAFSLLVELVRSSGSLPIACIGLSPWLLLDLPTVHRVRRCNPVLGGDLVLAMFYKRKGLKGFNKALDAVMRGVGHDVAAAQYYQDSSPRDARISPLLANEETLKMFPPVLLHAGKEEALAYDSIQLAKLCEAAQVEVELELYPGQYHVFQFSPSDAAADSFRRIGIFLGKHWR